MRLHLTKYWNLASLGALTRSEKKKHDPSCVLWEGDAQSFVHPNPMLTGNNQEVFRPSFFDFIAGSGHKSQQPSFTEVQSQSLGKQK